MQFDFKEKTKVSSVKIYWFDDTGLGQCRVPDSWKFLYREAGQWKEVSNPDVYGVEKDQYNKTTFDPVQTDSVRLEIQLQGKLSTGIFEVIIK